MCARFMKGYSVFSYQISSNSDAHSRRFEFFRVTDARQDVGEDATSHNVKRLRHSAVRYNGRIMTSHNSRHDVTQLRCSLTSSFDVFGDLDRNASVSRISPRNPTDVLSFLQNSILKASRLHRVTFSPVKYRREFCRVCE